MTINGLRSDRGVVRLLLCPARQGFPDCGRGGLPLVARIKDHAATAQFSGVLPGTYAIAAFHDENGNGRLDTIMGVPREGVGFSGNPSVRMRAPTFSECDFTVSRDIATQIKIKYLF